jgi:uncharacterized protein DUF6777
VTNGVSGEGEDRRRIPTWLFYAGGVFVLVVVVLLVMQFTGGGGVDEASAQTISFEEPTDVGEDPFTPPADIQGEETVEIPASDGEPSGDSEVGSGPFGGTGSDLVCDRELLIKSLLAQPDRMRAWAEVLGIDPEPRAVSAYIRSLTPTTVTVDTRVTNHTFVDGRAVPLQSILAAGTAVLVDKYGRPVVRCRCGNPLKEAIFIKEAVCTNCPPRYTPPPPCRYKPYRPWYGYPPDYLPPKYRDPYPDDYPKPRVIRDGPICYVLYPEPPEVEYPPVYRDPTTTEPEYTITDRYPGEYTEPEYTEPEYTEPEYTEPDYPETEYEPPPEDTPPPEEVPPEHMPEESGNTYCYEEDAPDRFEPGCQGTYGPPP